MKYYICVHCGKLKTEKEILKEARYGEYNGTCDCEYMKYYWDDSGGIVPWFPRVFNDYINISKDLYNILYKIKNNILRLEMFSIIPTEKRKNYRKDDYENI